MPRKTLLVCFALLVSLLVPASSMGAPPVDRYIVVLKDSVDSGAVADQHKGRYGAQLKHVYRHALKGYAARIPDQRVEAVRNDPRVAFVERDGEAKALLTQSGATWGLDRIDQRSGLSGTFNYTNTGAGVKAYIIDTGIRLSHREFGGRAVDGTDTVNPGTTADDCNGHGTHVAGTTGGNTYGVAKGVTLVGVRVLDCGGSGLWSGVIKGIDWVTAERKANPQQPAVANMSLGGGASSAVDTSVNNSINAGVSYAVAAGNSNQNACYSSPARVGAAMTISATSSSDRRASWANYGSCVDWFAPGVSIKSAWYTGDTATNTISGTSMATPHTAGVAALYLQRFPGASPQQVRGDALTDPEPEKNGLYEATTKRIVTSSKTTNYHLLFTGW